MARKTVTLTGEKELRIFMEPLRQRMLRTMEIIGEPVTSKKLADAMGITPSSAKHHLTKLESIGLVGVHHTRQIHGITAVFYALLPVTVGIGVNREDHREERDAIAGNLVASVYKGFCDKMPRGHEHPEAEPFWGDVMTGAVHLTQEQANDLRDVIARFVDENGARRADTMPFEYALVLYNAGDRHEGAV